MTGPDLWFSLAVVGLLFLFWELFHPGLIAPAGVGLFLLLAGVYHLARLGPTAGGVALMLLALVLFVSELTIDTRFVGGVTGSIALAAGALKLYSHPPRIHTALAIIGVLLVAPLTTWLSRRARMAKTNKRADL